MAEDIDPNSDDLVGFALALKRALPDKPTMVLVSTEHEHARNAESDVVYLRFPDGREIELHIVTLDKPSEVTGKRDFITIDETLQ